MREIEIAGLIWTWDDWRELGLATQSELMALSYPEVPRFRSARGTTPPVEAPAFE